MLIGHKKQWEFLKNKIETDQLAHAFLFSGEEGIGKKLFAKEFSEFIGCRFPDLMVIAEEKEIPIAKIREVQNFLAYKSYNGGYKVVIVDDAEKMNQEAQSCFLKTLEEPRGKTLMILISSKSDMLFPTILSRCQKIKFFKPNQQNGLPINSEKVKKEQKILKSLMPVINSNLAEKFKYVKSIDFQNNSDSASAFEIIEVLQNHFRQALLKDVSNKKIRNFLELSEDINQSLLFTNANSKLALEILLMEL